MSRKPSANTITIQSDAGLQSHTVRLELHAQPPQQYQGGTYRFAFGTSGTLMAFENI